jgi:hypothetical protein
MSSEPLDESRLGRVLSSEPAKTAAAARCYQLRSFGPLGGPQDDKCRASLWMKADLGGCCCHPSPPRLQRLPGADLEYYSVLPFRMALVFSSAICRRAPLAFDSPRYEYSSRGLS